MELSDTRYVLKSTLGKGDTGTVYLAHDQQENRLCALKVLDWGDQNAHIARFKREFRAAAHMSSWKNQQRWVMVAQAFR